MVISEGQHEIHIHVRTLGPHNSHERCPLHLGGNPKAIKVLKDHKYLVNLINLSISIFLNN